MKKIQQKNCLPMVLKVVGFKQVVVKSVKLTPKVMIIFQDEDSVLDLDWEEGTSHVGRRDNSSAIKQRHYKQLGEGSGMYSSRSYFTVATKYKGASTNKITACLM